ncbi:hypothetical protein MMC08_004584 [Hypocenomyce scalaris]|nr:hypothetical protein [Hypocenomyce scalaris]
MKCSTKGRECCYEPSKRGGPRFSRKKAPQKQQQNESHSSPRQIRFDTSQSGSPYFKQRPVPVPSLINPGAGLRHLDFSHDSDFIFDSIFSAHTDYTLPDVGSIDNRSADSYSEQALLIVREYDSDRDILDAYYVFIHPYFPILPPPVSSPAVDRPLVGFANRRNSAADIMTDDYEPSSPISLAISAILALIPHPDDQDPSNPESVHFRREHAQSFAQSTMESIEIESELLDSSTSPSRALSGDSPSFRRQPFHPKTPIEVESTLALLVLSIYEYAQRGNITKMRSRAGQALISAMNLGLHSRGNEEDDFSEARRRAWWMTVWSAFMQAQQIIVAATQFIIDQNKALQTRSNLSYVYERMQELDSIVEPLVTRADTWSLGPASAMSVDSSEAIVAIALKGIARIKLNSYSGNNFPFSKHLSAKVCLKAALNIAQSFETLPYPNPTGTDCFTPTYLIPNSCVEVPRTMPAFACCAMQSSYAMLMLCHKTRVINCNDFTDKQNDSLVSNLLGQLRHGLQMVLGALKNYSVAFEALDGMRDQIEGALDAPMPPAI